MVDTVIGVTGATGQLGKLVTEFLLKKGAKQIVVLVRNPKKLGDLAPGVTTREFDYSWPPTKLAEQLKGIERLLLVSSNEIGQRFNQHSNVVEAARLTKGGIKLIAYTSVLHAETSSLILANEHKLTEEMIKKSGIPFIFLRNGWYTENFLGSVMNGTQSGMIFSASGNGTLNPATRIDMAEGAANAVILGNPNSIYEIAGDETISYDFIAKVASEITGKPITHKAISEKELATALIGMGLPEIFANALADSDVGIGKGLLSDNSGDLHKLLGRKTTSLHECLAIALKTH